MDIADLEGREHCRSTKKEWEEQKTRLRPERAAPPRDSGEGAANNEDGEQEPRRSHREEVSKQQEQAIRQEQKWGRIFVMVDRESYLDRFVYRRRIRRSHRVVNWI